MNNVLCLGDFSSGKSAFLNMLLGVSILPEQLQSTNLPVIKILSGETAGIYLREEGQKYGRPIASWSKIPTDWSTFEYVELTVPNHPLLDKGLVLWDSPGVNSTNAHHREHLEKFLKKYENRFQSAFYFLHGNLQNTHIEFMQLWKSLQNKLTVVVNIKEVKSESDCRKIENQVKKDVRVRLGSIPVELLYIGDVYDEFATISAEKQNGMGDQQRIAMWDQLSIDFESLKKKHEKSIIGDIIFDILKESAGNHSIIEDYDELNKETSLELALRGDYQAQRRLVDIFTLEKNFSEAYEWIKKGVLDGDSYFQFFGGFYHERGIVVSQNYDEAFKYYSLSAEQGCPEAIQKIGEAYFYGRGAAEDNVKAVEYFRQAADLGDADARCYLGVCCMNGFGVPKNIDEAVIWWNKSFEGGNPRAAYFLGECYYYGNGRDENKEEAVRHWMFAAENGDELGQNRVGECFDNGFVLNENSTEAVSWYKKSFDQGNLKACYNLAICYANGKGVAQDQGEAVRLARMAAEQNLAIAQNYLGLCYDRGEGVPKNESEAAKWFTKAAELNNPSGQFNLGICYVNGEGVEEDEDAGIELIKKSARQGYEAAQKYLEERDEEWDEDEIEEISEDEDEDDEIDPKKLLIVKPAERTKEEIIDWMDIKWVPVEGGEFTIYKEVQSIFFKKQIPYCVKVDSFFISATPITFTQFDNFCNLTGYPRPKAKFGRGKQPVTYVNVADAVAFCNWLSKETGTTVRLPEEDEWEYAAKGGNKSKGYIYSGSNNIDEVAWYEKNSENKTHEVATKKANELGIYDMSGNVDELCGTKGVFRGGCWLDDVDDCQVSSRYDEDRGTRDRCSGFRILQKK